MLQKHRTDAPNRPLPAVDRGQLDARIEATSREIGHLSQRLDQIRRTLCVPDHDEASTLRRHILARRQYLRQLETLRDRARA